MSSTPDPPIADDDQPAGPAPSPSDGAPGVEIGLSETAGGTFEPEEDPDADE
jgi:hypothetical protein